MALEDYLSDFDRIYRQGVSGIVYDHDILATYEDVHVHFQMALFGCRVKQNKNIVIIKTLLACYYGAIDWTIVKDKRTKTKYKIYVPSEKGDRENIINQTFYGVKLD